MIKGKAVKAVSLLWIGSLAGAGLGFLTQVIIARGLGADAFGAFSSALAFITFLVPLAGFGLPQFWLKVFGEEGWRAIRWLRDSLAFALLSTLFVIFIISAWALVGEHDSSTKNLYLVFILFVLGQVTVELVSGKLQLEENYLMLAAWQLIPHALRFLTIFACFEFIDSDFYFYGFGGAYFIAGAFLLLIGAPHIHNIYNENLALAGHGIKEGDFHSPSPGFRKVAVQSAPFGIAGSFHLIYFQSAVFLLAYLVGDKEAGIYSVAFLVMSAVYLFPNIIYQKFLLPKIHRWANQDPDFFYKSYRVGSIAMLGVGTLASLLVWTLSPYVLPLLFGAEYENSVDILRWLSLCAPLRFMATSVGSVLVTQHNMIRKIKCMGVVAGFSLTISALIIPELSVYGALLVAFLSEALLLGLYLFTARRYVFNERAVL